MQFSCRRSSVSDQRNYVSYIGDIFKGCWHIIRCRRIKDSRCGMKAEQTKSDVHCVISFSRVKKPALFNTSNLMSTVYMFPMVYWSIASFDKRVQLSLLLVLIEPISTKVLVLLYTYIQLCNLVRGHWQF